MEKLTIFIDMDGVLANFDKAKRSHPDFEKKGFKLQSHYIPIYRLSLNPCLVR